MSGIIGFYSLFLVVVLLLGYSFLKWRWEREALRQQDLGAATFTAYLLHRILFCPNPSIRGEFGDPDRCHPGCPYCIVHTPPSQHHDSQSFMTEGGLHG